MDAACLLLFVVLGRDRHHLNEGVIWFLTVLWPLAAGWIIGALITRLYTRDDRNWLRLAGTIVITLLIGGVLRGAFTNRVSFSIFTVVALAFISLTTFAWRVVWLFFDRRRRTLPAR
jgi:predicted Na+-dependent transporter